jgi:phage terminase large subunit GpA-like protein
VPTTSEVRRQAMRSWLPPPQRPLSDWIEAKNLRLPASVGALPGPLRLYGYQRGIADAISDPLVEKITLVKAAQVGFSTLVTATIGHFVCNDPAQILCVLPTESDCRDYTITDIDPIFQASPVLRSALTVDQGEENRNTMLSRRFSGGSLKIVASHSPRNLRRHVARVLLIDEADACETSAEGRPNSRKRRTFCALMPNPTCPSSRLLVPSAAVASRSDGRTLGGTRANRRRPNFAARYAVPSSPSGTSRR